MHLYEDEEQVRDRCDQLQDVDARCAQVSLENAREDETFEYDGCDGETCKTKSRRV